MIKDVRRIFEGQGILEKTSTEGVVKKLILGATLISSPNSVDDVLVVDIGDYGYEYLVDSEDVIISSGGTIEFESLDAKYQIRKVGDGDVLGNLNPDTNEEEEESETNV